MATQLIKWIRTDELYPYYILEKIEDKLYGTEIEYIITDEFSNRYDKVCTEFFKIQEELEDIKNGNQK